MDIGFDRVVGVDEESLVEAIREVVDELEGQLLRPRVRILLVRVDAVDQLQDWLHNCPGIAIVLKFLFVEVFEEVEGHLEVEEDVRNQGLCNLHVEHDLSREE
jgi:hypothetical protein